MKDLIFQDDKYGTGFRGNYDTIVESFGYEVVAVTGWGDYQGTLFYLLKDGDRFGALDVGYGSCSGCDSLEACSSRDEVIALQMDIFSGIKWYESPQVLVEELLAREDSSYYGRDQEAEEFLKHLPRLSFRKDTLEAIRDVNFPVEVLNDMLIEDGHAGLAASLRMSPKKVPQRLRDYVDNSRIAD